MICKVAKPHEMPVDEAGNRADVVMDPNSTISRMNIGRLYEQYINAASRDVVKRVVQLLQVDPHDHQLLHHLNDLAQSDPARIQTAWDYLMGYYQIVSPKMFVWFTSEGYPGTKTGHLSCVLKEGIYLYLPPDNDPEGPEIIRQLEAHYRPTYGPVTYVGNSGRQVVTKNPVRIGSLYMILLEKTGDDWTAVSSGKLQHYGVLAQTTNADKFSQPTRQQPIRALGESEVRIYASYAGPRITADILDRNNNPTTHRSILRSILAAERPTDIPVAVHRQPAPGVNPEDVVPLGGSKSLQLVKHIGEVAGWGFHYQPHNPGWHYDPTHPQHSQVPQHVPSQPLQPQPYVVATEPARGMPLRPVAELSEEERAKVQVSSVAQSSRPPYLDGKVPARGIQIDE